MTKNKQIPITFLGKLKKKKAVHIYIIITISECLWDIPCVMCNPFRIRLSTVNPKLNRELNLNIAQATSCLHLWTFGLCTSLISLWLNWKRLFLCLKGPHVFGRINSHLRHWGTNFLHKIIVINNNKLCICYRFQCDWSEG